MVAIFFVLTILILVSLDFGLQRFRQWRRVPERLRQALDATRLPGLDEGLVLPAGLFLHQGHTWAELRPSGSVRVGMDDFVRRALGRIDRILLLAPGERVSQGEPMMVAGRNGRQVILPAPVSGLIEEVNGAMAEHPEGLDEAYERGWAYTLRPTRIGHELPGLRVAETAGAWLEDEVRRFADWIKGLGIAGPAATLPDGGMPIVGVLGQLEQGAWKEFQKSFLLDSVGGTVDRFRN